MRVVVGRLAVAILATAICVHAQVNFSIDPSLVASGRSARGGSQYSWRLPNWGWAGFLGDRSSIPPTVFNIMDYNGYGDGRTDDSSAIQSAINAAQQAGGGTVIIPAGTFLLNNKIAITSSNVILKGAGPDKTKLYVPQSLGSLTTKYINKAGQSRFSWADGFVKISGFPLFSFTSNTYLGSVVKDFARGERVIQVNNPSKFYPGQWVRLFMSDPYSGDRSGSLASTLYGGYVIKSPCGNKCIKGLKGQRDLVRWAVRVSSVNGNWITLQRNLPIDVRPEWKAQFHAMPANLVPRNSGIQDLRVEFKLAKMAPHLKEAGYNGIAVEWALNCWVRNVKVVNADDAVIVRYSHHVTVDGVQIYTNGDRSRDHTVFGHIGIGLYNAADVQVTNFDIKSKMIHDTTVRGTMLCVFHNGHGTDLNLDSHRFAPFGTLYSNINVGLGSRVFTSGGEGSNGLPAAAYTTFWNLRKSGGGTIVAPSRTAFGSCTYGTMLLFKGWFVGDDCDYYWMERIKAPRPSDLYSSEAAERIQNTPNSGN